MSFPSEIELSCVVSGPAALCCLMHLSSFREYCISWDVDIWHCRWTKGFQLFIRILIVYSVTLLQFLSHCICNLKLVGLVKVVLLQNHILLVHITLYLFRAFFVTFKILRTLRHVSAGGFLSECIFLSFIGVCSCASEFTAFLCMWHSNMTVCLSRVYIALLHLVQLVVINIFAVFYYQKSFYENFACLIFGVCLSMLYYSLNLSVIMVSVPGKHGASDGGLITIVAICQNQI